MATRIYVIFGLPKVQARILTIFNTLFDQLEIDALCVPAPATRHLDGIHISSTLANAEIFGVIMTRPQRLEDGPAFANISEDAVAAQCFSAVRKTSSGLSAALFDGLGFVKHISSRGFNVAGASVYLAGANADAIAIASALAKYGARRIDFADPRFDRIEFATNLVVDRFAVESQLETDRDVGIYDLIVNTLHRDSGHASELNLCKAKPAAWFAEAALESDHSTWLSTANAVGLRTFSGLPFLRDQVRLYLDFFEEIPLTTSTFQ